MSLYHRAPVPSDGSNSISCLRDVLAGMGWEHRAIPRKFAPSGCSRILSHLLLCLRKMLEAGQGTWMFGGCTHAEHSLSPY